MTWFSIILATVLILWTLNAGLFIFSSTNGWQDSENETLVNIQKWSFYILNYPFNKLGEIKNEFLSICREIKVKTNETFKNKTY